MLRITKMVAKTQRKERDHGEFVGGNLSMSGAFGLRVEDSLKWVQRDKEGYLVVYVKKCML